MTRPCRRYWLYLIVMQVIVDKCWDKTLRQSCEKALKAVLYSQDANNVPRGSRSHNLLYLTSDPDMREQASLLVNSLGDNARMMYPDTVSRPEIPSDIFTRQDAEFALQIAKRMIELAEERVVDK